MKNLPFPAYLLLCFFMLMLSTPSQAIMAPTSEVAKEQIISPKQHAKLERLKEKLSKKMAKIMKKQNLTERGEVERKANRARKFGIAALVIGIGQFFLLGMPGLFGISVVALILTILSLVSSGMALKKIKNSSDPEQYKKYKKRARSAIALSIIALFATLLFTASWIFFYFFLPV